MIHSVRKRHWKDWVCTDFKFQTYATCQIGRVGGGGGGGVLTISARLINGIMEDFVLLRMYTGNETGIFSRDFMMCLWSRGPVNCTA